MEGEEIGQAYGCKTWPWPHTNQTTDTVPENQVPAAMEAEGAIARVAGGRVRKRFAIWKH